MATENTQSTFSLESAADLSSRQFHFVKLSSGRAALCGAGEDAIGVLQNDPAAANREAQISNGPIAKVKIGGACTQDGNVASDSTGRAVNAASGDYVLGKMLDETASTANTIVRVLVNSAHPIM